MTKANDAVATQSTGIRVHLWNWFQRSTWRMRRRLWNWIQLSNWRLRHTDLAVVWRLLRTFFWLVLAHRIKIFAGVLIVLFSIEIISNRSIVISPLYGPKKLDESGYTPEIAAKRLRDGLNNLLRDANTRMTSPNLALRDDLPDFVIPTVGLSVATITSFFRTFFRIDSRENISGEFTISEDKLSLRLRKNGVSFEDGNSVVDIDKPDELIKLAAIKVADVTVPYLNAVITSHSKPTTAMAMAQRIIAERSETDPNVMWAHVLVGGIYIRQGRYELAIPEFKKALQVSDRFWYRNNTLISTADNNIGLALIGQNKVKEAVAYFRTAISYDHDFGVAYLSLADAMINDKEGAQCERQRAITALRHVISFAPLVSRAHRDIGHAIEAYIGDNVENRPVAASTCDSVIIRAWNYLWNYKFDLTAVNLDGAINEYQKAIDLNPHDAETFNYLGLALVKNRKNNDKLSDAERVAESDKAIEAFYGAINAGIHTPPMRVNLANELHFRNRIAESSSQLFQAANEYQELIKLEPHDFESRRARANILVSVGDFTGASDALKAIKSNSPEELAARGYADFDAGMFDDAVNDFAQAVNLGTAEPNAAYVVLWLNLARAQSKRQMISSELEGVQKKLLKHVETEQWPLPIVLLFMNQTNDPEEILDAVKTIPDRACEAHFYIGEWYLLHEKAKLATNMLHEAADNCPRNYIEFSGASAELKRMPR